MPSRPDLANGQDQVEAALREQAIHLRRPGVVQLAFRLFADKLRRDLAQRLDIGAPVMHAEEILRHVSEHVRNLVRPHGGVRTQRGQDCFETVTVVLPGIARQLPGARVLAALIRRYGKNAMALAQLGQAFLEQII
jgi:hypothetical protein